MNEYFDPGNWSPKAAVGFSIVSDISSSEKKKWEDAHFAALSMFPWMKSIELQQGRTTIKLWGHFDPNQSIFRTKSGDILMLIGSPWGDFTWEEIINQMKMHGEEKFVLPWEGRCALILVDVKGKAWRVWNDWVASFPIYYAAWEERGIASCLEDVVVRVAGLDTNRFLKRGLVELLLLGHFLGTDTLYEQMKVIQPDSFSRFDEGRMIVSNKIWSVQPNPPEHPIPVKELILSLHDLTVKSIRNALSTDITPSILLTLSSGMDSRLVACVARDADFDIHSYTYGPREWSEVYFASQVAKALRISWERVDVGVNYTADYLHPWLKWFGSGHHAHGMYQFPFLTRIQGTQGIIPNGFLGNNMAGGDHPNDCLFQPAKSLLDRFCGYGTYWSKSDLKNLLMFDPEDCFTEIESVFQKQILSVSDWSEYQQMNMIDMWNRQSRSIFYQPMMYSYFGLERSPFMDREYARFCMSLPVELLRKRKLQIAMLNEYWPDIGKIGGTFYPKKGLYRKWHSFRYIIANRLPRNLRPLAGATSVNKMELDCAIARRWDVAFPITSNLNSIEPLRAEPILKAVNGAFSGNKDGLLKMIAVQPLVFRLRECRL